MKHLGILLGKEARELLTRQMLVPMVAMALLFVFIGRVVRSERARGRGPQRVLVADEDGTSLSGEVAALLDTGDFFVLPARGTVDELLARAKREDIAWVIVIPEGLADSFERRAACAVEVYNIMRGFSITQTVRSAEVRRHLRGVNDRLAREHLRRALPDADAKSVLEPLRPKEFVMVRDRVAEGSSEMIAGIIMSQTFLIPLVLLMVIVYSSQMIAASIGQEKENKTLETLLTVPVSRTSIVIGKMLGAALVALVIAAVFMAGMVYYVSSLGENLGAPAGPGAAGLAGLDIGLTLRSFAVLAVMLFIAVLAALSLATLLAVFAGDTRSAQMAVTPLMVLVMIPYLFSLFFDIETIALPLRIIVYAIPFSYPFLTPKAMMFGNYGLVVAGIVYMTLFAAACIFAAARVFGSEWVLTASFRLRRRPRS